MAGLKPRPCSFRQAVNGFGSACHRKRAMQEWKFAERNHCQRFFLTFSLPQSLCIREGGSRRILPADKATPKIFGHPPCRAYDPESGRTREWVSCTRSSCSKCLLTKVGNPRAMTISSSHLDALKAFFRLHRAGSAIPLPRRHPLRLFCGAPVPRLYRLSLGETDHNVLGQAPCSETCPH